MLQRRLTLASLAVLSTVVIGTAGYWIIGEGRWSVVDCLYMTIIGLTTAGFGEILPLGTTSWGRPFTILLLSGGVVSVGWFVASAAAFLIEGELTGIAWRRRMDKRVKRLDGHVVVCGAGSTGIHCVKELAAIGAEFVVVDGKEAVAREVSTAYGCAAVVGDATHDEVLLEAGIERARGCISALTEDKDNLFVTVTARALNPQLRIVAKAIDPKADAKLRRAGADAVVSPNMIGGLRMVAEMVRPEVVGFLDEMVRDTSRTLRIEEVPVPAGSPLAGRAVGQLGLERHKLLLLAVRPPAGGPRYLYNPEPSHALVGGETLIVLGEPERVRQLSVEAGAR
ncbi:MAG: potassium channel protein [Anaeromyxobacteraceae bacterium]|nr:potassium channel protein [Anaeromyxobacteraceae bacterium]